MAAKKVAASVRNLMRPQDFSQFKMITERNMVRSDEEAERTPATEQSEETINELLAVEPVSDDWKNLEVELAQFGQRLEKLKDEAGNVGAQQFDDLKKRHEEICREAVSLKQKTIARVEANIEEVSPEGDAGTNVVVVDEKTGRARIVNFGRRTVYVAGRVGSGLKGFHQRTRPHRQVVFETARSTSGKLSMASKDLGEGLKNAWSVFKVDMQRAADRLKD